MRVHNSIMRPMNDLKSELEKRAKSVFYNDFSRIPKRYVGQLYAIGKLEKSFLKSDRLIDRNGGSLIISYANAIIGLLVFFSREVGKKEVWMRGLYHDDRLEVISCNVFTEDTLIARALERYGKIC